MSGLLVRLIKILLYVLMGATLVFAFIFYFGNVVPGTEGTAIVEPKITDFIIRFAETLLIITAIITLVFGLLNVFSSLKALKQFALVLAGVAVLIIAAYSLASNELLLMPQYDGGDNVPRTLKWVGTGMITTYILIGLAVLAIIYAEISKYFKK
jgi:hypothetical protein